MLWSGSGRPNRVRSPTVRRIVRWKHPLAQPQRQPQRVHEVVDLVGRAAVGVLRRVPVATPGRVPAAGRLLGRLDGDVAAGVAGADDEHLAPAQLGGVLVRRGVDHLAAELALDPRTTGSFGDQLCPLATTTAA